MNQPLFYFIEILDIPLTNTFDAGSISTAQRYIKNWVVQVEKEMKIRESKERHITHVKKEDPEAAEVPVGGKRSSLQHGFFLFAYFFQSVCFF